MLLRKTALNLCAAAAVLAFALGAQGDNAGFAGNNQEVTPPPEFNIGARVFTLPSLREGAGVGNSNHTTSLPLPLPKGGEINLFPEGRENTGELRDILIRRANGEEFDMREWLAIRRLRFYENAERAFANSISQTAMQLSFVKRARVDLQTSLGGRKGAGGVDVAGALRETDDDIVGWQLRAYAGEDSAKGLNSGLFYRRIVNGALAGVNVFADYEDGDDGDFWRWSIGGDVKNRFGELSANHYFAITDAQMVGAKKTYTREGYDVDIAARIPRLEWAKARIGYYNFKGKFGDEDETGLRGGLDLSPGEGVVFGVEYDGEDGSFGGNISYTHTFGETQQEPQRAGDFNPRAHFYDSVRREYSQRISRTEGSGGGLVIVGTGVDVEVKNEAMTVTVLATSATVNATFPLVGSVTVTDIDAGNGTITMGGGAWHLTLFGTNNPTVEFLNGTVINIVRGMGSFNSGGGNISEVVMDGDTITLLGTRFDFNVVPGSDALITLHEGGLGIPASGVNVAVADIATVIANNMTVGCGEDETVMAGGATAKCDILKGGETSGGTVTAGFTQPDRQVGRFTLSSAAGAMATTETSGFTVREVGGNFDLFILMTTAMEASPVPINANMIISGENQSTRTVFFTVRVNPTDLAVSYVGAPNTAPLTASGDINIVTLTVANGYTLQRRAVIDGAGGDFSLGANSVLVLRGDNTNRRVTAVTIRGVDAHNTDSNSLSITVALNATPPPPMPMCSGADSTCRTLTVTPQNASDQTQSGDVTVGSVNLQFVFESQTLLTEDKVLITLLDGAAFTVTDEQVRDMLGARNITTSVVGVARTNDVFRAKAVLQYMFGPQTWRVSLASDQYIVMTFALNSTSPRVLTMDMNIAQKLAADNGIAVNAAKVVVINVDGAPTNLLTTPADQVENNVVVSLVDGTEEPAGPADKIIKPLSGGAGGTGDSALLELQFSPPQFPQVSYLSNTNQPVRLSSFPRRRESPRALGG